MKHIKEIVLVPSERIRIVKSARKEIQESLDVKLDFVDNSVEVDGEGLKLLQAKNTVKAIGRGFSPERAFRLFDEEQTLEVIDIGRNERIKARIIGTSGRTREEIERCTGAAVSVYGKTVSIIGDWEQLKNAKEAIEMLISGARHTTVYRHLEKIKRGKVI